jgi:hypothetical protein
VRLPLVLIAIAVSPGPALAERIENTTAVFSFLDKVTARISQQEVKLGETARFGSLKVTPRVCFSRPPTEPPKTTTFIEVEEVQLDGQEKRLFAGWMFAESPGLNAVEHPVFDVWLSSCAGPKTAPREVRPGITPGQPAPAEDPAEPRRRPRR